jgi:peroxiredoxin
MTQPAEPTNRPSPVLLVFLIFPLIGLAAAVALMASNAAAIPQAISVPTPVAVTIPAVPSPAPVMGAPMLDFTLDDLDGTPVSLSDYAGRIVFLNFWATWCEPCKRELPALSAFAAQQSSDGPAVLTVNSGEAIDTVRTFLDEQGIGGLTVLLDPSTDITAQYGVFQIPVTFVIDAQGIARYPHYGEIRPEDLIGYVQALEGATAT